MSQKERIDRMIELLRSNGYGLKDLEMLGRALTTKEFKQSENKGDESISEVLFRSGIPAHKVDYLMQAITLKLDNKNKISMGTVYTQIGNKIGVSSHVVEKRITGAIEIAWRSGDKQYMKKYLGEELIKQEHRPKNLIFISALVSYFMEKGLK